jgi:2-hydroxy-3-keto-5-methylthiopentenyl-1-phosphate phosphatase
MDTNEPHHLVTILCDFDGTISPVDLSEHIFSRFFTSGLYYAEQWEKGLIGTREQIDRTFATINSGPDEIAASLKGIAIDSTFKDLIAFARQNDMGLAVVSDGLDWPIEIVLAEHGIQGLPVYSNQMTFEGGRPVCHYPWYDPSTPMTGVCKPLIVRRHRRNSSRIIYIGDGRSDREAVGEADLVFAKDQLADYCRAQGIAALHFRNFTDICSQLAPWLAQIKKGPAAGKAPVQEGE